MKPDKEGLWEWTDDNGNVRVVNVIDVGYESPWLRVYYLGGYYNVHDECIGTPDEEYSKAEWPDRWGRYLGTLESIPLEETYGGIL